MDSIKHTLHTLHHKIRSSLFIPIFILCAILGTLVLYHLNGRSLAITTASYTSSQPAKKSDEKQFYAFLKKLFQDEVTANTLNLHFTLADPASADISKYRVTLGEVSVDAEAANLASLENIKNELQTYDTSSMSTAAQLTYDVLKDSIDRKLELAPYYYYEELLGSTNGTQAEYPILLAEYQFHSKKDIEDYLELLSQYDTYMKQICRFEKEKSKKGLFMNETAARNLIEQCRAFIPDNSKTSFWETTFSERLNKMKDLTKKEKKAYIKQNHEQLTEHVYPAYRNLIAVLKALKNTGKNTQGLCYFEDGKKYYELLVKSMTGSNHTIPELQNIVESQREHHIEELSELASSLSKSAFSPNSRKQTRFTALNADTPTPQTAAKTVSDDTPEDLLEHLKKCIQTSFPACPDANYTVKMVNKKLQDFLSPAFYLTSPLDQYKENCIYINPASQYSEIQLFTTLAHEGYPGHLYQTIYSYSKKLPPIRYLLYHGGYTEGWATYVEMLSYQYAGLDENTARALMLNQDATLSLYATIDMGVHYDGWSLADTVDFLSSFGITKTSVISNIYQTILENPANYLKYYIGYLQFLELKDKAKAFYGNDYSELLFHTAILDMGSAPFYILEKYMNHYYKAS